MASGGNKFDSSKTTLNLRVPAEWKERFHSWCFNHKPDRREMTELLVVLGELAMAGKVKIPPKPPKKPKKKPA